MGFVAHGSFSIREIEEAAFALKDGEVSSVILSLQGFHLVQRIETRERRTLTFEEARVGLEHELKAEVHQRARDEWMADLQERSAVEILVEELRQPPGEPVPPEEEGG